MKTQCPDCKYVFNAPKEYEGRKVHCTNCKQSFAVSEYAEVVPGKSRSLKNYLTVAKTDLLNLLGLIKNRVIQRSQLNITLCESYNDVKNDVPFRLVDDQDNVIRIKQSYPIDRKWDIIDERQFINVAGVTFRQEEVISFIAGASRQIKLKKATSDEYPHAIAVFGTWSDAQGKTNTQQLGYVPDEEAEDIADTISEQPDCRIVGKLIKMFIPTNTKQTAGLRIDIALCKKNRTKHQEV